MLKYLEYKGQKLPVRASMYAIMMLKEETGKKLSDLGNDDFEGYQVLMYYSLKIGHEHEGIEFSIQREDMYKVFDWCGMEFIQLIPTFFPKAMEGNQPGKQRTKDIALPGKVKK